jgi:predicted transcriptional regulator
VAESTFTFRVDDALKAAFAEVAANQERTAAQLLRVLMKDAVHRDRELREHDRWFRGEIDLALSEADDPATTRLAHESVRSSWQQQRATLERRAPGRPA